MYDIQILGLRKPIKKNILLIKKIIKKSRIFKNLFSVPICVQIIKPHLSKS